MSTRFARATRMVIAAALAALVAFVIVTATRVEGGSLISPVLPCPVGHPGAPSTYNCP